MWITSLTNCEVLASLNLKKRPMLSLGECVWKYEELASNWFHGFHLKALLFRTAVHDRGGGTNREECHQGINPPDSRIIACRLCLFPFTTTVSRTCTSSRKGTRTSVRYPISIPIASRLRHGFKKDSGPYDLAP